jgi:hypothetical protein
MQPIPRPRIGDAVPLLTFAAADVVRLTYFKLFLFIAIGMLAGIGGLHARQAQHGGRLERWGFRPNSARSAAPHHRRVQRVLAAAARLLVRRFILPGPLLLLILGSPLLGPGNLGGPASRRASAPAC